ncbi:MAG: ribose-phosphate pyrophosphokinase [Gammaproteobacteria bacterium]|nr:ribose-phosphate pyrophosphokinase [Gammaproteobacteria bacterium]MDD9854591.1 ribose-phosphate pyrophosphokinase [Gammaproteobacteria bacterium]MDD9883182.1 ribose-phosphate pyrophosphokinase [Gammaproteobacteria bacterium]
MSPDNLTVFTGNANPALAAEIVHCLGLPLGRAMVGRFSDGEVNVEVMENVRAQDVFVVQPTCAPSNDNLMELLVLLDALKRSSAARLTAVIPYFGYARQDRRPRTARVAISAKLVATMIKDAGADRVLTIDLHADQIQGFFDIPTDNIYASPVLMSELWRKQLPNPIVVSPDVGGVVRARALAKQLETELAIIDKRRPRTNEAKVMHIIGEVDGRSCILIDDMVDTANTLCEAAAALKQQGAVKVLACCTHPVLSGPAVERIAASRLDELLVTNSIPLSDAARACAMIKQSSVAELLAESIRRIATGDSISSLFVE